MALIVNNRSGTSNHILPQLVVGNVHSITGYVSNTHFSAHVVPTGNPTQSNSFSSGQVLNNKALTLWQKMVSG